MFTIYNGNLRQLEVSASNRSLCFACPLGVGHVLGKSVSGVGFLHSGDLLRGALRDQSPAALSPFRAEIDDPVGVANHIQVVFDDDDGIAEIR